MYFYELKCGQHRQTLVSKRRIVGFFDKVENIIKTVPNTGSEQNWFDYVVHEVCNQLNIDTIELSASMNIEQIHQMVA